MKLLFEKLFLLKNTPYEEICPKTASNIFIGKIQYLNRDNYDEALFWVDDFKMEEIVHFGSIELNSMFLAESQAKGQIQFYKVKDAIPSRIAIQIEIESSQGKIDRGPIKQVILQSHRAEIEDESIDIIGQGDELWWNFITSYLLDVISLPYDNLEELPIGKINIGPIGDTWELVFLNTIGISEKS